MNANDIFEQNDGKVTQTFYAELNARGPRGEIAVALFRAQKRSSRAKDYSLGRYRRAAYDVKSWSLSELCRLLADHGERLGFRWGWKEDPEVRFGEEASFVLYIDLPPGFGQCSFHSPSRGSGPDYAGEWDGQHASVSRILAFADHAFSAPEDKGPKRFLPPPEELETAYQAANAGNEYAPVVPPKGDEVFRAFDQSCAECNQPPPRLKFGDVDAKTRARDRGYRSWRRR